MRRHHDHEYAQGQASSLQVGRHFAAPPRTRNPRPNWLARLIRWVWIRAC